MTYMEDRILQGRPADISVTFYDGEDPVDSDDPVTIEVLDGAGDVLVPAGTATDAGDAGDGTYTFTLQPDHTTDLDFLEARWTATLAGIEQTVPTQVEIAGGFYVPLAEIRDQKNLPISKFSTDELSDARRWFEDLAEGHIDAAFVPRYRREVHAGSGTDRLIVERMPARTVRWAKADGTVEDTDGWTVDSVGIITRESGRFSPTTRYEIAYTTGHDRPPADLRDAALVAIRAKLLEDESGIANRDLSIRNEFGDRVFLATASEDHPTGIPVVDAVLNRYRDKNRRPVFA